MTENDLLRIRSLIAEEIYISNRLKELDSKMYSIGSPSMECSVGVNSDDRLANLIESRDKLWNKLVDKLIDILDDEYQAEVEIERLKSEERNVIRYYYLKGYDWETVADKMNYSISRVFQFRDSALKKLEL